MGEQAYGLTDIANELGVSRQAIWNRVDRGTIPEPDFRTASGPVWKRSTLEKAGILPKEKSSA